MKRQWMMTACAAALIALVSVAAVAKDHGDKGRGRGKDNYGQNKKRYRQFNEDQRRYARTYYDQNQQYFRQPDQWNDDDERLIQPGYVLDPQMRRWARPAPYAMTRGFGRPPRGYRYIVLGGHVILVDSGYRVQDAIHFDINIGH